MKETLIAIAASVALLTAPHASAQAIEGFIMGGTHRDSNREQFTGLGAGVVLTGAKWIGVGAQDDAFFATLCCGALHDARAGQRLRHRIVGRQDDQRRFVVGGVRMKIEAGIRVMDHASLALAACAPVVPECAAQYNW